MKSQKQTKLLFGFALSMMDKAIEMQHAKNEFQDLKNEELRLKSQPIKGEILELKSEEKIDGKLKEKVENDPLFKLMDDIFNPTKNKKIIDEIMKVKEYPSGGIIKVGELQDQKEDADDCPCPVCQLRRTLEGKERGFND